MNQTFTTITGPQFRRVCEAGLRSALGHYGWLVAKGADGRVIHSGTATCFRTEGNRFLLTADHVIEGLLESEGETCLMALRHQDISTAAHGIVAVPEPFPVALRHPGTAIRLPDLDVAVLKPSSDMLGAQGFRWFDAAAQERATAAVRQAHGEPGGIIQLVVVGFPNLARLDFVEERVQLAANRPVLTTLRSIDAPSVGVAHTCRPQMILEVDVDELGSVPEEGGAIDKAFQSNVYRGENDNMSLLGGSSGAPVLLCSTEGIYVVALAVQGNVSHGGRVFATPIDEILHALRQSRLFRAFLDSRGETEGT